MTSSDPRHFCLTAVTILRKSCSYTSHLYHTAEVCDVGDLLRIVRIHIVSSHIAVVVPTKLIVIPIGIV